MHAPQTLRSVEASSRTSSQRRTAVRYSLQAPVEFCWIDGKGTTSHGKGRTQDVSTKGIRIVCSASPPVGACVAMNVDIPLPGGNIQTLRIEIEGHVVRIQSSGAWCGFCIQNDRVICPE